VDDHKDTVEMLAAMLRLDGYEVIGAHSIADGLSLAASDRFDLIMLDWILTDGTGIDLCKRIRDAGSHTPIVFCSGMSHSANMEAASRAGAQGFLVKPVSLEELRQCLKRLLPADPDELNKPISR
jgi:DNA-binding response OmpR family regulator